MYFIFVENLLHDLTQWIKLMVFIRRVQRECGLQSNERGSKLYCTISNSHFTASLRYGLLDVMDNSHILLGDEVISRNI